MATVTAHRVRGPKRYSMYPTNGRMTTEFMVRLEGSKVWRRVYERLDKPKEGKRTATFIAVVTDGKEYRDLTKGEMASIGYRRNAP